MRLATFDVRVNNSTGIEMMGFSAHSGNIPKFRPRNILTDPTGHSPSSRTRRRRTVLSVYCKVDGSSGKAVKFMLGKAGMCDRLLTVSQTKGINKGAQ